jgi:AcrR family transcriptional regulator
MTAPARTPPADPPGAPRRRGRPPDQDSAATRQRVLDVARAMFAELGYEATTNRAIAEASGITPGAIYHYFDSKADLYAAVYEEIYDRVFSTLEQAIAGHPTLLDQFAAAIVAAGELNVQDPTLPAFDRGVSAEAKRHPELNDLLRPLRRRNTMFFRKMVAAAAERGELADDVDRRGLEDLLSAVAFGLVRISAVTGDNRRTALAVATLQRFLDGTLIPRR